MTLTLMNGDHEKQHGFSVTQINILKNTLCKDASEDDLMIFLMICKKTGLDPFAKQIHAVIRGGKMVIQTAIDGLRLIAERTKKYMPGPEPIISYKENGEIASATAFVKKLGPDGQWHIAAATAHFDEYAQRFYDRASNRWKLGQFWEKMPRLMISKCAEALALRRAFPAEMSGLYSDEEMTQADVILNKEEPEHIELETKIEVKNFPSPDQIKNLESQITALGEIYKNWFFGSFLPINHKISSLNDVSLDQYEKIKIAVDRHEKKKKEKENGNS